MLEFMGGMPVDEDFLVGRDLLEVAGLIRQFESPLEETKIVDRHHQPVDIEANGYG